MESQYPQVILFGSIGGDWREKHIIPVLDELGVSYFDPRTSPTWTEDMGRREAEVMEHCEVNVMYFNHTSPAFGGLTEAGWAALGTVQREQTFILCIERDYTVSYPWWARFIPGARARFDMIEDYSNRARFLVFEHAKKLAKDNERLMVVESVEAIVEELRRHYRKF